MMSQFCLLVLELGVPGIRDCGIIGRLDSWPDDLGLEE